jgi:WD40 repeat protein
MNADSGKVTTVMDELPGANLGWLRDGGLWVESSDVTHVLQHDAHSTFRVASTQQVWSPDGASLAYVMPQLDGTPAIYILDVTSHNPYAVASGLAPVWSPDGTQLAFWSGVAVNGPHSADRMLNLAQIQIADVAGHSVWTLVHRDDLLYNIHQQGVKVGDIAWSPDGKFLAVTMGRPGSNSDLFVLDADTGAIKVHLPSNLDAPCLECGWTSLEPNQAWSPDSRYVAAWATSADAWFGESGHVLVLDVQTGKQLALPGVGIWAWHPTGHWLAVPQNPNGILLVTPDLACMHWLDTPQCSSLAWRPVQ